MFAAALTEIFHALEQICFPFNAGYPPHSAKAGAFLRPKTRNNNSAATGATTANITVTAAASGKEGTIKLTIDTVDYTFKFVVNSDLSGQCVVFVR